ncbi:hypothetical protein G6L37_35195 [Agrobacterium rubi]|nr:hypothetical protein [Agrobacterium rubi]NTF23817.1 hypothetical protein [Agrobacterium rubi]
MYYATNARDPRLDYETENFADFAKMAMLAIKGFGVDEWSFEGHGVELDPVDDIGVPAKYLEADYVCHRELFQQRLEERAAAEAARSHRR